MALAAIPPARGARRSQVTLQLAALGAAVGLVGDFWRLSLGVLALEPVPLSSRTLRLDPASFAPVPSVSVDPYQGTFSRDRAPRDSASLQTIDRTIPNLDA